MKSITDIWEGKLFRVISEPGDATRYDYFVYRDGPDNFCIMPAGSTFRFPQRLNYWAVKDMTDEEIFELANAEPCNVYTLVECIRAIKELWEE